MSAVLDDAGPVRDGETLDAARIDAFLRTRIDGLDAGNRVGSNPDTAGF